MTRVLTAGLDGGFLVSLHRVLTRSAGTELQHWPGSASAVGAVEAMAARRPDVVLLGPGLGKETMFEVAARLERTSPAISVLFVTEPGPELWRRALEVGARGVIDPRAPIDEVRDHLEGALATARRLRMSAAGGGPGHRVVVVASPKGGVGKTVLATNLAVALASREPRQVVLVDLDLEFGNVAHALMLTPVHTISDAAAGIEDLDLTALKVYLTTTTKAELFALCAPDDPAAGSDISAEAVAAIVDLLTAEFSYVIVDTPAGFTDHTFAVLEHATDLVLVSDMDVPSVHNARKAIKLLDLFGADQQRRHFVLNRADSRVGLRVEDVATAAGLSIDVAIPSSRQVPISLNEGHPIFLAKPRAQVSRRIQALAERIAGADGKLPEQTGESE